MVLKVIIGVFFVLFLPIWITILFIKATIEMFGVLGDDVLKNIKNGTPFKI